MMIGVNMQDSTKCLDCLRHIWNEIESLPNNSTFSQTLLRLARIMGYVETKIDQINKIKKNES